jgi:murein endopeptidase
VLGTARCKNRRATIAASIGRATEGQLVDGCLLPERGPGWLRRNKSGLGTDETVALLQWALGEVLRIYPGTTRVVVGALSKPGGGPLPRHRSHQSGRDIDIGYYASDNRALPHFRDMSSDNIDVEKTWALIGALLHTGRVHMMFMDYNLQALLYQHLHDEGTAERTLRRIFQYPAGRSVRAGIIRHARGHRDHFHVRFRCPLTDRDHCVD